MSDNQNVPQPDPALRRLDRLVGTWTMEGNLAGMHDGTIAIGIRHGGGLPGRRLARAGRRPARRSGRSTPTGLQSGRSLRRWRSHWPYSSSCHSRRSCG